MTQDAMSLGFLQDENRAAGDNEYTQPGSPGFAVFKLKLPAFSIASMRQRRRSL